VRTPSTPLVSVRSRAPLRLGLAGGGTDVSPYSDKFGGAVLNATIDRFAFAFIEPALDDKVHFRAADMEVEEVFPLDLNAIAGANLKLHAATYRRMVNEFGGGRPLALVIRTSVDAPPGSGLGSSSALVVALVEAFRSVLGVPLGPYEIARIAFEIERVELALAGGKQDQYAAAFGGLNFIEFLPGGRVIVNPLRVSRTLLNELETSLVICFSGISRRSEDIIAQQMKGMIKDSSTALNSLHQLKMDSIDMKQALLLANIPEMARILNKSWIAKKETASGVSTKRIDELSAIAFANGALGCKISGAGGGGFIMFIVPPEQRVSIVRSLNSSGGMASGVQFTSFGVESWAGPNKNL
jgi:D-glycero-alpha-D-manno-heptose-7-phosphate kinase